MRRKIIRHAGILFLIALGAFLLFADNFVSNTPSEAKFAGVLALIWALGLIFSRFFQDKTGKNHEELSRDWKEKFGGK